MHEEADSPVPTGINGDVVETLPARRGCDVYIAMCSLLFILFKLQS
jgi:hypothetical protein